MSVPSERTREKTHSASGASNVVRLDRRPHLSDHGNAVRLVQLHGEHLRMVPGIGWHVWDGSCWQGDPGKVLLQSRIDRMLSAMYAEAAESGGSARAELAKWALTSESAVRIDSCMKLASRAELVQCMPDDLDPDPLLVGTSEGTLDLSTGQVREADPAELITRTVGVAYDADAQCPRWLEFLKRIQPDPEVRGFLQRAVGYSLTGLTSEQCMFVAVGRGANGKSVFIETVMALLAGYAQKAPAELLMQKQAETSNDVARMRGVRFAAVVETDEGRRLAESRVKELTGGDTISARYLHREFFDFKPVAKLWLVTNHLPRVTGTDDGIWRRLVTIPFGEFIPEEERDLHLAAKLREELPGIFAWAVQGCLDWQEHGLVRPGQVLAAGKDYRAEQDILGAYLEERCVVREGVWTSAADLYADYTNWCQTNGHMPASQTAFGIRLRERGYRKVKYGTVRWDGVALRASGDSFTEAEPVDANTTHTTPVNRQADRLEVRLPEFIAQRCVVGPAESESAAALYDGYAAWCQSGNLPVASQTAFGTMLGEQGFRKVKRGTIRWAGIALRRDGGGDGPAAPGPKASPESDPNPAGSADPAPSSPVTAAPAQPSAEAVITRRLRRPWTPKVTVYLTWSSGRGVTADGSPFTVPARSPIAQLLPALPASAQRVVLVGAMPGGSGPGLVSWATAEVPEGWSAGSHFLDPDALAARFTRPDGSGVDVHRLASWSRSGGSARPEQAAQAFELFRAGLVAEFGTVRAKPGERVDEDPALLPVVLGSPASTGRELLLRSLPSGHEYPVLDPEHLELIHHSTGQGRNELLSRPEAELPGLYGYDMRWSYAALCRAIIGSGPARLDEVAEFAGYHPGRYEVTFTIPSDWNHVGLLPVHGEGFPSMPGTTWRTWADARELRLADKWGWRIADMTIHRRLLYTVDPAKSAPLRTWADKLVDLREKWLPSQDAPAAVIDLARDFTRTTLLAGIGAMWGRRQRVTHSVHRDQAGQVPADAEAYLAGDMLVWTSETEASWREMVHPEWVSQVWAEQRCRLLDTGTSGRQPNAGALHLPYSELVALRTDALYSVSDPGWADPGTVGAFRRQTALPGPVPTPTSVEDLLALRES